MSLEELQDLMARADDLAGHPQGVEVAERAVQLSDRQDDPESSFRARLLLTRCASFAGFPDVAFVAFSWCLAQCDRDPERFPDDRVLWEYKWILESLHEFPQFSLQQTERAFEDAKQRYRANGYSPRPLLLIQASALATRGETDRASSMLREALASPRDEKADCVACEPHLIANVHLDAGEWTAALDALEPVLTHQYGCTHEPARAYALALHPLCELGRMDEAKRLHKLGCPRSLDTAGIVESVANHIQFLLRTENHARAVEVFDASWKHTLGESPLVRLHFGFRAALLFEDLQGTYGPAAATVRIPRGHALFGRATGDDAAALASWFREDCESLADALDARNETPRLRKWMSETASAVSQRLPLEL